MNVKNINIDEYNYNLPDERIAKYPVEQRDSSKLLHWNKGEISQHVFNEISDLLESGDLLVYNNTKVIQARLRFTKETGANIEIFCLEPHLPSDYNLTFQTNRSCQWKCMIGNAKKWKEGPLTQYLFIKDSYLELHANRKESDEGMSNIVEFTWNCEDINFGDILAHMGELPIPPYLNRETEDNDKETYQTVYSRIDGSVAAPTAGLHFTRDVLRTLTMKGVKETEVTLHVGAGTFQPVKSETIGDHPMHQEMISVTKRTINEVLESLGHIIAVGTTSVRTLESLYYIGCNIAKNEENPVLNVSQWQAYDNENSLSVEDSLKTIIRYLDKNHFPAINAHTKIIIAPGYEFKIVNKIITNFHQPKSTLLLLISAFVGNENWKNIYNYALNNNFRFLSYGDSSLLVR